MIETDHTSDGIDLMLVGAGLPCQVGARLASLLREYARRFGLDRERAARLGDGAIVMHPGPMNRGVEIAGDITELPNVVVTEQVANGVAVRMAVLFWLLGADPVPTHEEEPADA